MNEADVLVAVLGQLRSAVSVPVHTEDAERGINVPGVVLVDPSFAPNQRRHGHQTYAGTTTDGAGNETGIEQHFYFEFDVTVVARSEDEEEADDLQAQIFSAFAPHVDDPRSLHADFCELEIGRASRRVDPLREPEWFETGRTLRLLYLSRVTTAGDTLEAIDEVLDPDL